ncbi:MAG: hypothetical protein H7233_01540 [Pseudorhodobacter sp.]|nr:hypothetical protein [Frankiaceae bacterium]
MTNNSHAGEGPTAPGRVPTPDDPLTDQDRLRVAEQRLDELLAQGSTLRPGPLAERISRETGSGLDAARLVVSARSEAGLRDPCASG